MVIAVLAVLAGADGWDEIVEWARARASWLRTFLALRGGIPSADTVRRLFEVLDPKKFAACFDRMVAHLASHMPDQLIAIDGKAMRRTFSRSAGVGPLHVVSRTAPSMLSLVRYTRQPTRGMGVSRCAGHSVRTTSIG